MHHSAHDIPRDHTLDFDVCIVGAGAAGMTLAMELIGSGLKVCLLESGGFDPHQPTQDLYQGSTTQTRSPHAEIDEYRYRMFGGTTCMWGGGCLPYDPIDFEKRSWVPNSGWPISRATLDPYYLRACPYVQIGATEFDKRVLADPNNPEVIQGIGATGDIVTKYWKKGPPPRFGTEYRERVVNAKNIDLITWANATDLVTNEAGNHVDRVLVRTLDGNRFYIRAKQISLCMGGFETPRLLMACNAAKGIGDGRDNVGRYYSPHFNVTHGRLALRKGIAAHYTYEQNHEGIDLRRFISLSDDAMRQHELLNCKITIETYETDQDSELERPVSNVLNDPGANQSSFASRIIRRGKDYYDHEGADRTFTLNCSFEQSPNPDSRLTLTGKTDALGMPRLNLNYCITDQDLDSAMRTFDLIAMTVGQTGVGRLCHDASGAMVPGSSAGKSHHTGTTRMASSPNEGVVDSNCRVFGVSNLFVTSAGVFPTPSHANPTFTIAAMAIRLADHLKGRRHV